ncbi:phage minor head protein [Pseudonocardia acidicola]|uniref:Phage head morphogenesis domain-containing protein n=1 Tax=Pseudonocardia acidicola TaxID=2724939 RepID=A0ABX1SBG2_9PSEU|nr:phage minor head protein [Pseudonocardia acidicola]NMH98900.1 hypothetical protein [Pseudonocardia acidicola]
MSALIIYGPVNDEPWQVIELAAPVATPPPTEAPQQQEPVADGVVISALVAALAAGAGAGLIAGQLSRLGVPSSVARAVADNLSGPSGKPKVVGGPAQRAQDRLNLTRRSQYLVNAARRVYATVQAGKTIAEAIAAERGHFDAHRLMQQRRQTAGAAMDAAAQEHGPVLGWNAVLDGKTDAVCAALDGKNFSITHPPKAGLPGAVHPFCRCTAGPPHPGAPVVGPKTKITLSKELTMDNYLDFAVEQGHYGELPPIEAPCYDRSGRRLDTPATPDFDDKYGALAPSPSQETIDEVVALARNNPHLMPSLNGLSKHEIAKRMLSARVRVPVGFNPVDGSRGFHDQQPQPNADRVYTPEEVAATKAEMREFARAAGLL